MTARHARGLVVGKFAPLHRGHELVVERALALCDEVVVLSYSRPEPAGCGAHRRARWLAARFPRARQLVLAPDGERRAGGRPARVSIPANDAAARAHRRFVGDVCRHRLGGAVDAVFTSEAYGAGFAAELTRYFRRHRMSDAPVRHHAVDPGRWTVPISGTAIRADVHAARRWLAPEVYSSFVRRVCVLGGESSGKTTLAAALAEALRTLWVPEYARALWERKHGMLTPDDMSAIARRQVVDEEATAGAADRVLVCDTSPLATAFYDEELFGRVDGVAARLAARRYDLTVLCAPDFPFVQDGTRQDAAFRARQHAWYLGRLARGRGPWLVATGSVEQRVGQVREALALIPSDSVDP
ncbi:MAG TPA: AAA family ATPase [Gemmatimonadaceae bacterium]|nr:AAA family ATPase [Gemmatimonadaceae bacterium]